MPIHRRFLTRSAIGASSARRIDDLCDQFEQAWRESESETPEISHFFAKAENHLTDSDARVLLKELLIIDLNYRKGRQQAEPLGVEDYSKRFPGCETVIQEAFIAVDPLPGKGLSDVAGDETSRVPIETASDFRLLPVDDAATNLSHHLKSTINEIPEQLGGYIIETELGQGGMGVVYRAHDQEMDRTVAIKVMKEDRIASREAIERFRREIRLLANLNHENIVRAYHTHVDEATSTRYLVMEYVDGTELESLCRKAGKLAIADACELIRQGAVGLQHAHENGLIHRDIKPSNLMLTASGKVKVLDLGLARPQSEAPKEGGVLLTQEGQWLGTPYYMSPEQGMVQGEIDHRTDIYSLGCTLFRLLAGRVPFGWEQDATMLAILMQHAHDEFPRLSPLRRDVPRNLERLILRAVSKSPADRFSSAAELAAALEPFCRGCDLPALFRGHRSDRGFESSLSHAHRNVLKTWALWGGALLLIALAAAAFWFTRPKSEPLEKIDIISAIDIHRDPLSGDWTLNEGTLTSPNTAELACFRLPETLPAEFRLEITALRKDGVKLMFAHRSEETPFILEFQGFRVTSGILAPGAKKEGPSAPSAIIRAEYDIENLQPQTLVFDVRSDHLTILRDGKPIAELKSYGTLPEDIPGVPDRPGFYIVVDESQYEFSNIELTKY